MFKRITRLLLVVGAAISALALAQPALGYTELKVTGTVGVHSLWDTEPAPGATCRFDYSAANSAYKLKHINVSRPLMKAVPGMGTERVGWDMTVQRRIVGLGGTSAWDNRYTSPIEKSSTDASHNASFANELGVKVIVPYQQGADASAEYRVIVKLFWYKADGTSILGTAKERVDWYYPDQGKAHPMYQEWCPDYD